MMSPPNATIPATVTSSNTMTYSNGGDIFGYTPSLAMAYFAGVLFSISALMHIFQYFKLRSHYLYLFMAGVLMEVGAYWFRVSAASRNPVRAGSAALSFLLITIAPSFLAAACYMTFGRIVHLVTPESRRGVGNTWVPTRHITTIFVTLDFVTFFIQCIGIILMITYISKIEAIPVNTAQGVQATQIAGHGLMRAYRVLQAGFIMQIVFFLAFLVIAFRFMFVAKSWRFDWPDQGNGKWRKIAWAVIGASALVMVRSLHRTLMFSIIQGNNYIRDHEWTFYMFDALPILAILVLFNFIHPGHHIPIEYTTVSHGYKRPGFRNVPLLKEPDEEEEPAAGYSKVSLVPPPLAPPGQSNPPMQHASQSAMTFTDPWTSQPSPRY